MIQLSAKQFAKLKASRKMADERTARHTKHKPSAKPRNPGLVESGVVAQLRPFLEFRGWRLVRTGSGLVNVDGRRYRHGEPGMADELWLHYSPLASPSSFWIETKREKGGKLRESQIKWQAEEKARGGTVLNVGHCTNAPSMSFNEFMVWYENAFGFVDRFPSREMYTVSRKIPKGASALGRNDPWMLSENDPGDL